MPTRRCSPHSVYDVLVNIDLRSIRRLQLGLRADVFLIDERVYLSCAGDPVTLTSIHERRMYLNVRLMRSGVQQPTRC